MITFNDIPNAISATLTKAFPTHTKYFEEITQKIHRPAFHINVMPESSVNFNKYYREQNLLVDITYFSDEQPALQSKTDNFDMINKLQNVLNMSLEVKDRKLNIQQLNFDIIDRLLHATFNLMWYNENEVTEAYLNTLSIIKEVIINGDVTHEVKECQKVLITKDGEVFKTIDGNFYVRCSDEEVTQLIKDGLINIEDLK